jgi:hypothetical protein
LGAGDSRLSHLLTPVRHGYHASANFKGELQPHPQHFPRENAEITVALIAGVMRGFERVVALPNPKDIEFRQPLQLLRRLKPSGPIGAIE